MTGNVGRHPSNPSKDASLTRLQKEMIEAERHSPNGGLRAIQLANGYDFDHPPAQPAPTPRPTPTQRRRPKREAYDLERLVAEVEEERAPADQTPAERIQQVLAQTYRRLNP